MNTSPLLITDAAGSRTVRLRVAFASSCGQPQSRCCAGGSARAKAYNSEADANSRDPTHELLESAVNRDLVSRPAPTAKASGRQRSQTDLRDVIRVSVRWHPTMPIAVLADHHSNRSRESWSGCEIIAS